MIDREEYLTRLTERLTEKFGSRLVYIGLQGSYQRGEADDNSDFDVMLVLDGLSVDDLDDYRGILVSLGHHDLSCGFVCGCEELAGWNPLEACHVLHTTEDVYRELQPLLPKWNRQNVIDFVKMSVGNLYHELCHRRVHGQHENSVQALPMMYKSVFFILQNIHWLRTGEFAVTKKELAERLDGEDQAIMETALMMKTGGEYDFGNCWSMLFDWCKSKLCESYHMTDRVQS